MNRQKHLQAVSELYLLLDTLGVRSEEFVEAFTSAAEALHRRHGERRRAPAERVVLDAWRLLTEHLERVAREQRR